MHRHEDQIQNYVQNKFSHAKRRQNQFQSLNNDNSVIPEPSSRQIPQTSLSRRFSCKRFSILSIEHMSIVETTVSKFSSRLVPSWFKTPIQQNLANSEKKKAEESMQKIERLIPDFQHLTKIYSAFKN